MIPQPRDIHNDEGHPTSSGQARRPAMSREAACQWHEWGATVVAILQGDKGPTYPWKAFQQAPQSRQSVLALPWEGGWYAGKQRAPAWGVGIINGPGGWRCFDLDRCPAIDPVRTLLAALGLPDDYPWVVRTGSGQGWHLWVRCEEALPPGVLCPTGKAPGVFWGQSRTGAFDHLELRWQNCQTLTPPSQHPTGPGYHWADQPPTSPPAVVSAAAIVAAFQAIASVPPLAPPPPHAAHGHTQGHGQPQPLTDQIRATFDLVAFATEHFQGEAITEGDQVRITGQGGLLLKPDTGQWYCFADEVGGDAIDLVGYARYGAQWDRHHKEHFRAALLEAAAFVGLSLPAGSIDLVLPAEPAPTPLTLEVIHQRLAALGEASPAEVLQEAYTWVETAASLSRVEVLRLYQRLRAAGISRREADGWKGAIHEQRQELVRAAKQAQAAAQTQARYPTSLAARDLPQIVVNERQLRDITADGLRALIQANATPQLFVRGGVLTRVLIDEHGHASAQPLDTNALKGVLTRCADFVRARQVGTETFYAPESSPPVDVVNDVLSLPGWPGIPPLVGITTAPVLAPDGTLEVGAGYLPKSCLYHAAGALDLGDTTPGVTAVAQARALLLDDLLGDFPFADHDDPRGQASRANALALLLLPFLRPMIPGPTPLHFIDAPQAGTGKGLLADAVTLPFAPAGLEIMTAPTYEEEWRKRITAALLSASSHVLIDNVVGTLKSGTLAAALTAPVWTDRLLGLSQTVTLPIRTVWVATGNNVQLDTDMARRCVWIRLDAGVERPWMRQTFKHTELRTWARQQRSQLVTAALTLIRAWLQAGQPLGQPVGSYEPWAKVMHGLMQTIGVSHFLGNADDLYSQKNPEHDAWTGLVEAWWAAYGSAPVGVAELFPLASHHDTPGGPPGRDLLGEYLGPGGEQSRKIRLGRLLRERLDRVFGAFKLTEGGAKQRAQRYALVPIQPVAPHDTRADQEEAPSWEYGML